MSLPWRGRVQVTGEQRAAAQERQLLYEGMMETVRQSGKRQAKFDLCAASDCKKVYEQWPCWQVGYTHVPGIEPGQKFAGRGWLDGAGIHCNYYGGICYR